MTSVRAAEAVKASHAPHLLTPALFPAGAGEGLKLASLFPSRAEGVRRTARTRGPGSTRLSLKLERLSFIRFAVVPPGPGQ